MPGKPETVGELFGDILYNLDPSNKCEFEDCNEFAIGYVEVWPATTDYQILPVIKLRFCGDHRTWANKEAGFE